jgi:hypothetical protein
LAKAAISPARSPNFSDWLFRSSAWDESQIHYDEDLSVFGRCFHPMDMNDLNDAPDET